MFGFLPEEKPSAVVSAPTAFKVSEFCPHWERFDVLLSFYPLYLFGIFLFFYFLLDSGLFWSKAFNHFYTVLMEGNACWFCYILRGICRKRKPFYVRCNEANKNVSQLYVNTSLKRARDSA